MFSYTTFYICSVIGCIWFTIPSVHSVGSSDMIGHEGSQCREAFECFKCSTMDGNQRAHCADPLNETMVRRVPCKEFCVKWIVSISPTGDENAMETHYIRTCSEELEIRFPINAVCMHETRTGNGHICFCAKKLCNSASSTFINTFVFAFAFTLALLVTM